MFVFSIKRYVIYIVKEELPILIILLYVCQVDTLRIRNADSLELIIGMLGIRRLICVMSVMEYMNSFIRDLQY